MKYVVVAGVTRPALALLDKLRAADLVAITLLDPKSESLIGADVLGRVDELSGVVIRGDHTPGDYITAIRSAIADGSVVAVCPTVHFMAMTAAEIAERMSLPGPSTDVMAAALRKDRVRAAVAGAGLSSPRTWTVAVDAEAEVPQEVTYPAVVKPVDGYGKFGTALVGSPDELAHQIASYRREQQRWSAESGVPSGISPTLLVEEFVSGPLFSIECCADSDGVRALVVVRRKISADNPVLELGSTIPGVDSAAVTDSLMRYAEQVLRAVGLQHGVFHVEVILGSGGPVLVEINPRISGGAIPDLVRAATGIDLCDVLLDVALGRAVAVTSRTTDSALSHSFLAAREAFVVPALPDGWFDTVSAGTISAYCDLVPTDHVPAMANNTTAFGLVRYAADGVAAAEQACDRAVRAIGDALGASLWLPTGGDLAHE